MTVDPTTLAAEARYRTAWRRWGAMILDGIVVLPLAGAVLWAGLNAASSATLIPLYVLNQALALGYSVGFHARCGQTPGKWVMRIKVVTLSERPIRFRHAALRDSPSILVGAVDLTWGITTTLAGNNPFRELGQRLPAALGLASVAWCFLELITMLSNRRRRAIHDWIAGTVVVRVSKVLPVALQSATARA